MNWAQAVSGSTYETPCYHKLQEDLNNLADEDFEELEKLTNVIQ
jgi:hypothetical protein